MPLPDVDEQSYSAYSADRFKEANQQRIGALDFFHRNQSRIDQLFPGNDQPEIAHASIGGPTLPLPQPQAPTFPRPPTLPPISFPGPSPQPAPQPAPGPSLPGLPGGISQPAPAPPTLPTPPAFPRPTAPTPQAPPPGAPGGGPIGPAPPVPPVP